MGVPIIELIHPDDARLATEAWNEVVAGTDVDAVTIRLGRLGGGFAWSATMMASSASCSGRHAT